jgi:uncharacterized protein YaaQ
VRLVFAVVQAGDVGPLLDLLSEQGFSATKIQGDAAVGRHGLAAVVVGVDDAEVDAVISAIHTMARGRNRRIEPLWPLAERAEFWVPAPDDIGTGGATVFVLPVRRYERMGYA